MKNEQKSAVLLMRLWFVAVALIFSAVITLPFLEWGGGRVAEETMETATNVVETVVGTTNAPMGEVAGDTNTAVTVKFGGSLKGSSFAE